MPLAVPMVEGYMEGAKTAVVAQEVVATALAETVAVAMAGEAWVGEVKVVVDADMAQGVVAHTVGEEVARVWPVAPGGAQEVTWAMEAEAVERVVEVHGMLDPRAPMIGNECATTAVVVRVLGMMVVGMVVKGVETVEVGMVVEVKAEEVLEAVEMVVEMAEVAMGEEITVGVTEEVGKVGAAMEVVERVGVGRVVVAKVVVAMA